MAIRARERPVKVSPTPVLAAWARARARRATPEPALWQVVTAMARQAEAGMGVSVTARVVLAATTATPAAHVR
jgi:hypothetical protein